ncbi:hypothetical protein PInf_022278 [Phytophthora infestans]|nr:hypothetical protein PInf_022278 [Phytophthora infestans]
MGYEFLTHVQNDTLPLVLDGRDVLAKGKTGNGKTIAFLLPTLERMLTHPQPKQDKISALLTRREELTQSGGIDVLVSTPGRLQAHLEDNSGPDRLLDMGFRPDIMRIISHLPKERQTLLFSATLPAATEELKDVALRDDYVFVDTIEGDDQQTNTQAVQEYVVCDLQDVIPVVEGILEEHMKLPAYKVIVFLPTARSAQFMAQLFQSAGFQNVLEMHRARVNLHEQRLPDAFRKGKKMIMFLVRCVGTWRRLPRRSLVCQVGLTDRDQYIHRLGRTARAGMEGRGILCWQTSKR